MNFQSFDYMQAIAQAGSFTKAARQCHVTQQTLSAHVAALERELGCQLVVRSSPLALTHEGETFLAHGRTIRENLGRMQRELAGDDRNQTGALRIGVAHTRGRVILPRVVERFCSQYPNISLDIREGSNAELNRALAAGELDLGIGAFDSSLPNIELHDYYEERIVLLATDELLREHGIDPKALTNALARGDLSPLSPCPFVLGPPEDITGELALRLIGSSGFSPIVRARSSNMETLLALSLHGVGASIDPENLVSATATPEQKHGLHAFDLGPKARYKIRFGLPARGYRWSATDTFMRIALEESTKSAS